MIIDSSEKLQYAVTWITPYLLLIFLVSGTLVLIIHLEVSISLFFGAMEGAKDSASVWVFTSSFAKNLVIK